MNSGAVQGRSYKRALPFAMLAFGLIGSIFLLRSFASSASVRIQPESGSKSGSAVLIADGGSSDGNYLYLGSGSFGVVFSSPAAGSAVSGTVTVRAGYWGNVQNVEFFEGGTKLATGSLSNGVATATIDTTSLANGAHSIFARAWDSPPGQAFTETADSGTIAFTVQNGSPTPPPPGPTPPPSTSWTPRQPIINVKDYGAAGNGSSDDQNAIQQAINAATGGGTIYFPAGTYNHSDNLSIDTDNTNLWTDQGAVIHGTSSTSHQIQFSGSNGSGVYDLTFTTVANQGVRGSGDYGNYRLNFADSTGNTVRGVTIDGAGNFGITMNNTSNYLVENSTVKNTGADAIHSTHGAHDGVIRNNTVIHVGDDCYPVVSPISQPIVYNVLIENNTCTDSWGARGIAVVGGRGITIRNNVVDGTKAAGIYIASEASFSTHGSQDVRILDNQISNASREIGHASIFMYADSGQKIEDVLVAGNTMDSQVLGAAAIVVQDSNELRINIIGNFINETRNAISVNTAQSEYNLKNNKQNGKALPDEINNPSIIPAGY